MAGHHLARLVRIARGAGAAGFVRPAVLLVAAAGVVGIGAAAVVLATPRLQTTKNDFYFYGTQPQNNNFNGGSLEALRDPQYCAGCHQDYSGELPNSYTIPYDRWRYSLMAHAYRDPVFQAQFQIAEKDAGASGEACIRCHAPAGFIENRATPSDGSALLDADKHGVSCIVCHRQVDPVEQPYPSPPAGSSQVTGDTDRLILEALGVNRSPDFANGGPLASNGFVYDTKDRRRGPFDLGVPGFHQWAQSPFHTTSAMCASCHDVSNPIFVRQPDGTYSVTPLDTPHPTGNKYDMYPMDRTYSEWLASAFAQAPVEQVVPNPNGGGGTVGRYSFDGVTSDPLTGAKVIFNSETTYAQCQDCHQPASEGQGCELNPPVRPNVPVHNFNGGNSWVLRSVWDLFGYDSLMDNPAEVDNAVDRNKAMLKKASDLTVTMAGSALSVRVINETGHRFPGGFSEGRRAWVNVRFLDAENQLIGEHGAYNFSTAVLDESSTKVYESKHGLDAAMSLLTGLPQGPSFHIDLNNKHFYDNRIPPRGFTNAGFEAVQAAPVGYSYADGQHWDDTQYTVPAGAVRAEVRVYFQTTGKDYIEFLRDNATDVSPEVPQPQFIDFDGSLVTRWTMPDGYTPANPLTALKAGEITYAQWLKWGQSIPVEVDYATINLISGPVACSVADVADGSGTAGPDGILDGGDFIAFINAFAAGESLADIVAADGPPGDGIIDGNDFIAFINGFAAGC